jgi:cytosine/uracil/thiamine/allantoin permease
MSVLVYVIIFGGLAIWAARDAKQRIAAGANPRDVGGGPVSIFFVVLIMPVIGRLFYLYKRNKHYSGLPK